MEKKSKKKPPAQEPRTPAHVLLKQFLINNNIEFIFRKQKVRYTEDNAMLIEPPLIVAYYKDEVAKYQKGA